MLWFNQLKPEVNNIRSCYNHLFMTHKDGFHCRAVINYWQFMASVFLSVQRTGCLHINKHTRVLLIQQLGFLKGNKPLGKWQKEQATINCSVMHIFLLHHGFLTVSFIFLLCPCVCVWLHTPFNGGVMKGLLHSFSIRSLLLFLSLSNKSRCPIWDHIIALTDDIICPHKHKWKFTFAGWADVFKKHSRKKWCWCWLVLMSHHKEFKKKKVSDCACACVCVVRALPLLTRVPWVHLLSHLLKRTDAAVLFEFNSHLLLFKHTSNTTWTPDHTEAGHFLLLASGMFYQYNDAVEGILHCHGYGLNHITFDPHTYIFFTGVH